ncbi:hypothetical protein IWQ57_001297, partial [Coemansia nantahalensis]
GEGIQIYSAADSKCLRSWTFPPGVRFACPARYRAQYTESGEIGDSYVYVALDAGDGISDSDRGAVVWRWTDKGIGSIGVEDRLEATLRRPVLALEPGATAAGHMFVVHRDGSTTLTSEALEERSHHAAAAGEAGEAIWYQLMDVSHGMRSYLDSRQVTDWLDGDVRLALALTRVAEADGTHAYSVSLLAVEGGEASISEIGTTRINPMLLDTQPLACAFDADVGTLAVLTETGAFVHFGLSSGSSALDDAIVLEHIKTVALCGFVPCVSEAAQGGKALVPNLLMQSQLTMAALTERYVAIAGTHSTVSRTGTGPYESVLTVWDLQYGCLHAEQPLGLPAGWLQGASRGKVPPRLTYQIQPLNARAGADGEQMALAVTVAHTTDAHAALDGSSSRSRKQSKKAGAAGVAWGVKTFVAAAFLPQVTLLAALRLQNNPKYFVDPVEQASRGRNVHPSNMLLHEEQEQGLGVLRSGWEAVVDGTAAATAAAAIRAGVDTVEAFVQISKKREDAQREENEVLLALANVSDAIDSDQYTRLFMEHVGAGPDTPTGDTWLSAHLMTTAMRRCFAEPLDVSRSSRLPLFAPRVIEFMLVNCGLCNAHAPSPGLLRHLLARVDQAGRTVLAGDPAWELVHTALRRCPDLPEDQVVGVLRLQLTHYAGLVDSLFDLTQPADADAEPARAAAEDIRRTVSAVASMTGSDDMLRLALAGLPLSHAACVLRLLVVWMRAWAAMGASVEMAASAGFAQTAATALALHDADEMGGPATSPISAAIASANDCPPATPLGDSAPAIDSSLAIFTARPDAPPAAGSSRTPLDRVFTRKWAPALALPAVLAGAPELGAVVDLATLLLDAHLSRILLSAEFATLVAQLTKASDEALHISDQLKLLRIGLAPFHMAWEKQQERRVADDRAQQKQALGLDEVVLLNGTTRSQAERQSETAPNAACAQGTGPAGTYWERIQKLERYRVEVMHW